MRHNKKFNHLGRQAGHRHAMLANMATSLILHKRIETTVAKAKALKQFIEPVITKSKEDTTHSRRIVFSYLRDKHSVSELYREIAPRIMDRPGGYTRILHTGFRFGDAAEMCIIELVDFNEAYTTGVIPEAKTRTRRSRATAKRGEAAPAAVEGADVVGSEVDVPAPAETKKATAKKPAAAKPVAAKSVAKKPAAVRTSGAKTASVKSGVTKKG